MLGISPRRGGLRARCLATADLYSELPSELGLLQSQVRWGCEPRNAVPAVLPVGDRQNRRPRNAGPVPYSDDFEEALPSESRQLVHIRAPDYNESRWTLVLRLHDVIYLSDEQTVTL